LAVTSARRWPDFPDVPTMLELGYLERPYDTLFGVVAPAGTPAAIVARLNATINEGLRSAETRAALAKLGIEPLISTPEEFAAMIAEEAPKWAEAVRVTGIKVEGVGSRE
jgi:tripartite-type tricarboxylate transporter receptor subunit TctC